MSWENVKLGEISEFSNGVNFDKSDYSKGVKYALLSFRYTSFLHNR